VVTQELLRLAKRLEHAMDKEKTSSPAGKDVSEKIALRNFHPFFFGQGEWGV
jgi:hypothetical protein